MSRKEYSLRHKALGLCRVCPREVVQGSSTYCTYHRDKERISGRKVSKKAIVKLKNECLAYYGKECCCCGIDIISFLTIDHIEGKGNIQRRELFGYNISGIHMYRWLKKNNFPSGYRILCMNCNWATRYGDVCPHKMER
jgi:hypothetical protein